ncbi:hypothetical protein BDV12DRAFT_192078 [Aspergillus spectabilis]
MRVFLLSTLLAITLASPSLAQSGAWTVPPAGQSGTITDPSRVYCIINDGRLEASPDCTTFTSNGAGGFEAAGGWLAVNEDSNQIEIAPGSAPAFRWQGTPKTIGGPSTELLSYFDAAGDEPVYGPTWNHVPGTNYVAVWTGNGEEAPLVLSFVPESS